MGVCGANTSREIIIFSTYVITISQRYGQTDRETDRQTTCRRPNNTALCVGYHLAVKKA